MKDMQYNGLTTEETEDYQKIAGMTDEEILRQQFYLLATKSLRDEGANLGKISETMLSIHNRINLMHHSEFPWIP